jgi:hypothetical protein
MPTGRVLFFQCRYLIGIVATSQFCNDVGVWRAAARDHFTQLLKIVFMTGWRYGHEHSCRLVAGVANIVGHTWRDKNVSSWFGVDRLLADQPLALTFQYVECFFLGAVNVEARREAGRKGPLEH